jgi:surface protein
MSGMFQDCSSFNQDLSNWDTSEVTDMTNMFQNCTVFNENIRSWNVKNDTPLTNMFSGASAMISKYIDVYGFGSATNNYTPNINFFNITKLTDTTIHQVVNEWSNNSSQNQFTVGTNDPYYGKIEHWDTSQVTDMSGLFLEKTGFNDNISNWNTSGVTDMSDMFHGCTNFNQNISNWDTSGVTNMSSMFQGCTKFDQNIRSWTVTNVTSFTNMFSGASAMIDEYAEVAGFGNIRNDYTPTVDFFNITKLTDTTIHQVVNEWSNNSDQDQFTDGTTSPYYGPIKHWDTSQVTNMSNLFNGKSEFNDDISNWNTSKVTNMNFMFNGCTSFNQDVSFDTSQVTSMYYMFAGCTDFNEPVSFDTSHVTNMSYMFAGCTNFNQNVRYFVVADTTVLTNMFLGAQAMIKTYSNVPDFGSEDNNYTPTYEFFNQN